MPTKYGTPEWAKQHKYEIIDNYIYLYHVKKFLVIPTYPSGLQDQLGVRFNQSTPMSRSAPIYSYSDSGPRTLQIVLDLHRDMFNEINYKTSNINPNAGDDYVDTLIKYAQAAALPAYDLSQKMVDPPMVAVRFGNEIYIKGVIIGNVGVAYDLPILDNDKYAKVGISFTVYEVDPYDAQQVLEVGSFRGIDTTLERNFKVKSYL